MADYIRLYSSEEEYVADRKINYDEPWLSATFQTGVTFKIDYNKTKREKLLETPLTFVVSSPGVIMWKAADTSFTSTIEYKKNDGEWVQITSTTAGTPINVAAGDVVQFRGDNAQYASNTSSVNTFSGTTCSFSLSGNIMSLTQKENFESAYTLQSAYTFAELFNSCTGLTDASDLLLPATTLADFCYNGMFWGCTSLTTAPELPATTLTPYCYINMFGNCESLTSVNKLPATTLAQSCYQGMFRGCSSLTASPELLATTLVNDCYRRMFYGCTNLNYIKCLATDISASNCTTDWVNGVASAGTFYKNDEASGWTTGNNGIPNGWNVVTKWNYTPLTFEISSPGNIVYKSSDASLVKTIEYRKNNGAWTSITSTTAGTEIEVASGDTVQFRGDNAQYATDTSVYTTFSGSTCGFNAKGNAMSLLNSTGFSADTALESAYTFTLLFSYCTGLTGANNLLLPATTLTNSCYRRMFEGCISLASSPELPSTTLAEYCYNAMFRGTNIITAPELPASALPNYCYYEMFQTCTALTTAPELPATTLGDWCYRSMFWGCESLTTPPELPATAMKTDCYLYMFRGCTGLTSAPELPATTLSGRCYGSMFYGCTSITEAPELPATTLANSCYQNMFYGCTGLTEAPELPASAMADSCYAGMFYDCSNLNYIKCLATINVTSANTANWVNRVASAGTFVKADNFTGWTIGNNGIPTNWVAVNEINTIPLTFEIISGGVVSWYFINNSGNGSAKTIEYKINNGEWTEITSTTGGTKFNVSSGDTVQFRGNNTTISYSSTTMQYRNEFSGTTARFNVKGNVMSLLDKNDFANKTTFDNGSQYTFFLLFNYCTGLTNAKNLILPATALTENCYRAMFQRCANLTEAPELPATTLAQYCYYNMFNGCTSLTTAPSILPATTLAYYCYSSMFYNCTSLTTAPELPATTLASNCYANMFYGCTGLTTAPSSIGNSATIMPSSACCGMFSNCTSLTTVPALPATTLAEGCYLAMFQYCTSLTEAPELPATTLADSCYNLMFRDCTSLTTAPELPATTLVEGCYSSMFRACTSLTEAPELPATTLADSCYNLMFRDCTSLTTAPELPATTLVEGCYYYMFYGCSSLNYIKCLATNISATDCTTNWVNGVASAGTFYKSDEASGWTTGNNGIPNGWNVITKWNYTPLTFEVLSDGKIAWKARSNAAYRTIEYSKNGGEWITIESNTYNDGNNFNVVTGDIVQFRGNLKNTGNSAGNTFSSFSATTCTFKVYGNIMSLFNSTEFATANTLNYSASTYSLFYHCTGLTDASNLLLPATTLTNNCYYCMFEGCTSLTTAPKLPATTLVGRCYVQMFYGCNSLTTAPELPATTLAERCYAWMFSDCTSLNYIRCLATNISATNCTTGWVNGVQTNSGTFVKDANMSSWTTGVDGIPTNWTVQNA